MAALSNSIIYAQDTSLSWLNGRSSKSDKQSLMCRAISKSDKQSLMCRAMHVSLKPVHPRKAKLGYPKQQFTVRAILSDNTGRQSGTSNLFVGGFILGGLIVAALGYVYAPKISNALAGADKKELMKKLPWYDEEKALEKTRKILEEKIAQLNSAIDGVTSELRSDDATANGSAATAVEVEVEPMA